MVVVLLRLIVILLAASFVVTVIYRVGKGLGWWGGGVHATSGSPRRQPSPRPTVPATAPEPLYPMVTDIWQRVTTMKAGVWRVTRGDKKLRFWVEGSIAAANAVLYLERITGPARGTTIVEVFTFRRGSDQPELRRVTVSSAEEEMPPVHQGPEFAAVAAQQPADDDIRRLRTDLSMSMGRSST